MLSSIPLQTGPTPTPRGLDNLSTKRGSNELKETFQGFVGETFFQMMLKSMHSMHGKPAYLHGGQAEEIFQSQLDQRMASDLAQNSGAVFSNNLYEQFMLQLKHPAPKAGFGVSNHDTVASGE